MRTITLTKLVLLAVTAFFINGRLLSGAQPFEEFKKIIDEELKDSKSKKS